MHAASGTKRRRWADLGMPSWAGDGSSLIASDHLRNRVLARGAQDLPTNKPVAI